uniref:Uncharacterized protein n=1 Tax=Romanomermis culicivorax TaxID=13658 RepID=A0A915J0P4_ROMCU
MSGALSIPSGRFPKNRIACQTKTCTSESSRSGLPYMSNVFFVHLTARERSDLSRVHQMMICHDVILAVYS